MKDLLEKALSVVAGLIVLWVLISVVEVNQHNMEPDYEYNTLNFFSVLFEFDEWLYSKTV